MARASTYTLLPLDRFASIVGIDLFEFNQITFPGTGKGGQACKDVLFQHPYQKDRLSREEIAIAVAAAESMIADELGYWPAPKYEVNEVQPYPRPYPPLAVGRAGTPSGKWKSVQVNWHKVISGGLLNRTAIGTIESGENFERLDRDSDGIFESFQATITVPAGTLADEIGVYFSEGDRLDEPIGEIWRIRPVKVTVSGTTATIKGAYTLLVKPAKTFAVSPDAIDFNTEAGFVSSLEVYRVFTDTTQPYEGVAVWDAAPGCTGDCGIEVLPICMGETDYETGQVYAAFDALTCWPQGREPDRLQVNYLAGLKLENGQMQTEMANCVAYLAASLLASEKCGCDRSNRILAYWQQPVLTFEDDTNKARGFSRDFSSIPFPVTRGGVYAWQRVSKWRDVGAISL